MGSDINKSLSCLSKIVSEIVKGKTQGLPFRESKLTTILRPSFEGNSQIILMFCLNPLNSYGAKSSIYFCETIMKMPPLIVKENTTETNQKMLNEYNQYLLAENSKLNEEI